jgi:putative oxidoreductase
MPVFWLPLHGTDAGGNPYSYEWHDDFRAQDWRMAASGVSMEAFCAAWSPRLLSVLRIVTALLILQFGLAKIVGFPAVPQFAEVPALSLTWIAGLIELVLGALLLVGLFSRLAAFVLSGEMAFAYFIGHAPQDFFPVLNGGTLAILFCFVFLYLAAAGGGPWGLDALRRPSAARTAPRPAP